MGYTEVRLDNEYYLFAYRGFQIDFVAAQAEGHLPGPLYKAVAEGSGGIDIVRTDNLAHEFLKNIILLICASGRAYCSYR